MHNVLSRNSISVPSFLSCFLPLCQNKLASCKAIHVLTCVSQGYRFVFMQIKLVIWKVLHEDSFEIEVQANSKMASLESCPFGTWVDASHLLHETKNPGIITHTCTFLFVVSLEELEMSASHFRSGSRRLQRKLWWQNIRVSTVYCLKPVRVTQNCKIFLVTFTTSQQTVHV